MAMTTRSSTRRRLNESTVTHTDEELPKSKKAKTTSSKAKGKAVRGARKVAPAPASAADSAADSAAFAAEEAPPASPSEKTTKTVVIEHCKQCNSFKTRAILVKNGLENGVPGITVLVNPEKPRRGCFEVREEGGEKFITLLDMKRPFAPMKALDMDKVISDIVGKIN